MVLLAWKGKGQLTKKTLFLQVCCLCNLETCKIPFSPESRRLDQHIKLPKETHPQTVRGTQKCWKARLDCLMAYALLKGLWEWIFLVKNFCTLTKWCSIAFNVSEFEVWWLSHMSSDFMKLAVTTRFFKLNGYFYKQENFKSF